MRESVIAPKHGAHTAVDYRGRHFKHVQFGGLETETFNGKTLPVLFDGRAIDCRNMQVVDGKFLYLDMRGSDCYSLYLERCQFLGCDARGVDFDSSEIQGVKFTECNLRGATFDRSYLTDCTFTSCQLDGATFDRCIFTNCTGLPDWALAQGIEAS